MPEKHEDMSVYEIDSSMMAVLARLAAKHKAMSSSQLAKEERQHEQQASETEGNVFAG